jgi:hypothetical protein
MTLHAWMVENVESYSERERHPVSVELGGVNIPPEQWPLCYIRPESDVRIYPVPYGTGLEIAAWAAVAVAVASAAYTLFMMSGLDSGDIPLRQAEVLISIRQKRIQPNWVTPFVKFLAAVFTRIMWSSRLPGLTLSIRRSCGFICWFVWEWVTSHSLMVICAWGYASIDP